MAVKLGDLARLYAYDLETTRIEEGTPELLYITAFGDDLDLSMEIGGGDRLDTFRVILETHFLIPQRDKAKFIAWNGNRFDAYFIAHALLLSDQWILQPYLTASKALRGIKVKSKKKYRTQKVYSYEFLDGISMTGMVGVSLKKFLKTFAPHLPKLDLDLEEIDFDPRNPAHVAYARRDSEGLYFGMRRVESIIQELTKRETGAFADGKPVYECEPLKPTIGNLAINYFMARIPETVKLKTPADEVAKLLHGPVKRGGYCWCMRQYVGKVWKYDINQAYASAMREEKLPAEFHAHTSIYKKGFPGIYECTIARKRPSKIPFYYKTEKDNVGRFTVGEEVICWITSIEVEHLQRDGWTIKIHRGFYWTDFFDFTSTINNLEELRSTDADGPSGPLGTMVKAIGNNAYGKTLEQLNNLELVLSKDAPEGYDLYDPLDPELDMIWCRTRPAFPKKHHLPQIGVFITAHVRCKVRDTALLAPDHFLYADTDCVVFSKPVPLDIHKTRYGAWKVEAEGEDYIIVGKKIYYGGEAAVKAKGLMTRKLNRDDYLRWLNGTAPVQTQIQRNNFLKFLGGNAMFRTQERNGTDVNSSNIYGVQNGNYIPK